MQHEDRSPTIYDLTFTGKLQAAYEDVPHKRDVIVVEMYHSNDEAMVLVQVQAEYGADDKQIRTGTGKKVFSIALSDLDGCKTTAR